MPRARTEAVKLERQLRPGEELIRALLLFCGVVSIFTTIGILYVLGSQAALFLQSRAWLLAKLPVTAEEPGSILGETIDTSAVTLTITAPDGNIPFNPNTFVQIGDERMRVTAKGRRTIDVERGQLGTTATDHSIETPIFAVIDEIVKSQNALSGVRNTGLSPAEGITADGDRLVLPEGAGAQFVVGDRLEIGPEDMLVTAIEGDVLIVDRAQDGTPARAHDTAADIFLVDLEAEDERIELLEGFAAPFNVGDEIMVNEEIMLIEAIEGDTLLVERGFGSRVLEHDADSSLETFTRPTLGEFFTSTVWQPQGGDFGIWPLLTSTVLITLVAMAISIPLGLGAAIYLSEYADMRLRNVLKPILEILAGVPTVVYGFFALTFVTPALQGIFGPSVGFYNMLSAGLVVGILLIPLISSLSEDALSAVPRALREASYGLGATKLETTVKIVLPAAISGVLSAIILAASRAVGETMIVALAAGSGPNFTFNLFNGAETMTGHIVRISGGDLSYNSIDYNSIYAIGAMLFVLTLLLNLVSSYVSNRLREAY